MSKKTESITDAYYEQIRQGGEALEFGIAYRLESADIFMKGYVLNHREDDWLLIVKAETLEKVKMIGFASHDTPLGACRRAFALARYPLDWMRKDKPYDRAGGSEKK